jgi:hypothetical protein
MQPAKLADLRSLGEDIAREDGRMSGRSDAELRALLEALPIVGEEPAACRQLRRRQKDALASHTLGPVSVAEAVRQAAKVHPVGQERASRESVVVGFRGHTVDDGVAIWRTAEDGYRMHVWHDHTE